MALTGHTSSITFGTSGFTAAVTEIGGATIERPVLDPTDLAHSDFLREKQPGDTGEPGTSELTFFFDPDEQPPVEAAPETITRTFPTPAGMSAGATKEQTGFISGWSEPSSVTDELMQATATIQWSGDATWTDAAV